mgnify:CR=1 FL=1
MPGIRIWDPAGNLILDETMRTGRRVTEHTVTGTTGSFTVPGLTEGEPWDVFVTGSLGGVPVVSYSGTTVSWTWDGDYVPGVLLVGIY